MNHLVCNMFSQIQSGQKAQKRVLFQKKSKVCGKILDILWEEGYILGYRTSPFRRTTFEIFLKYSRGKPVVNRITASPKTLRGTRILGPVVKELKKGKYSKMTSFASDFRN